MSLNYQLVRSAKRKTVGLHVRRGEIIVRAPYYVNEQDIATLVNSKADWLLAKQSEQQLASTYVRKFKHGEKLWVKGTLKTLNISYSDSNKVSSIYESENRVYVQLAKKYQLSDAEISESQVKHQLEVWLKELAESYITARLQEICQQTQLFPHSYKIKRYKARWGSCNSRKELSFNYLIMMAPLTVVDYVIVHELCHLKFLNHSIKFWQLVEQFYPNVKAAKNWLKAHQIELTW